MFYIDNEKVILSWIGALFCSWILLWSCSLLLFCFSALSIAFVSWYYATHNSFAEGNQMQLLLNVGGPDRVSRFQMAEAVAHARNYNTSLITPVSASSVCILSSVLFDTLLLWYGNHYFLSNVISITSSFFYINPSFSSSKFCFYAVI